jgi:hypothetical protein
MTTKQTKTSARKSSNVALIKASVAATTAEAKEHKAAKKAPKTSARKTATKAPKASAPAARRELSPRALIRARFHAKGPDAAVKFGVTIKGMSESTVKRYVAYFASKAGKAEEKAREKRAK